MADGKDGGRSTIGWWLVAAVVVLAAWWLFSGGDEAPSPGLGGRLTGEGRLDGLTPAVPAPGVETQRERGETAGRGPGAAGDTARLPGDRRPTSGGEAVEVTARDVEDGGEQAFENQDDSMGGEEPLLEGEEALLTEAERERLLEEALILPPPEVLERLKEEAAQEPSPEEWDHLRRQQLGIKLPSEEEMERMRRKAAMGPTEEDLERLREQAERFGDPWPP